MRDEGADAVPLPLLRTPPALLGTMPLPVVAAVLLGIGIDGTASETG